VSRTYTKDDDCGAETTAAGWPVWGFAHAVFTIGALVIFRAVVTLHHAPFNIYMVVLAILTIASSRLAIKIPGQPARVSVSEVFIFTSVLLFGPAAATVAVAIDGLLVSCTGSSRRWYRTVFNVAEPAIAVWIAGKVFFTIAAIGPLITPHADSPALGLATIAMTAVYFLSNSTLTAIAIGLETGAAAFEVWRHQARHLAINYYAGASLATLAVATSAGFNFQVAILIVPLIVLSYAAYKAASGRLVEAHGHVREVERLYHATVEMLAIAVDAKDRVTHGHIRRVQRHTLAVCRALGLTSVADVKAIEVGSLLHDIGKLVVPDYVLNKPGALTPAEYDIIKCHAHVGATILTAVEFPYPVVPIVRHHHEQWDGRGYPDGLAGEEIPLAARVLSVVDCFDALTSDRPYRTRLSDAKAIEIICSKSGVSYDPIVVEKLIEMVETLRQEDRLAEEASRMPGLRPAGAGPVASLHGRALVSPVNPVNAVNAIALAIDGALARISGAEGCLFVIDAASHRLVVAHATPRLTGTVEGLRLEVGSGLSGWVASNRAMIRNSDSALDLGPRVEYLGLQLCMSVPVFSLGEIVAVLTVYLTRSTPLTGKEARRIAILAQDIGLRLARSDDDDDDAATAGTCEPCVALAVDARDRPAVDSLVTVHDAALDLTRSPSSFAPWTTARAGDSANGLTVEA
jgi:putative nucleotidyltransferase with HDIG domain